MGSPFSVYGENFLLLAQNLVIVFLLWTYEHDTPSSTKVLVSAVTIGLLGYLYTDTYVPEHIWALLMNLQFIMLSYARIPQILQNFRTKSTGQLALITFALNFAGNCARLFTFLKETSDALNTLTAVLAALLNFVLVAQILLYWGNNGEATGKTKKSEVSEKEEIRRQSSEGESKPTKRAKRID